MTDDSEKHVTFDPSLADSGKLIGDDMLSLYGDGDVEAVEQDADEDDSG